MAKDAAELALQLIKADSAFCSLVTNGADNILETGDMLIEVLHDAEAARRDASGTGVLGVSVQDAGEQDLRGPLSRQTVVIRPLDRRNGFAAVRACRLAVMELLDNKSGALEGNTAVVLFAYTGRTGHRVDRVYEVDFEAITFIATVEGGY